MIDAPFRREAIAYSERGTLFFIVQNESGVEFWTADRKIDPYTYSIPDGNIGMAKWMIKNYDVEGGICL